MGVAGLSRVVAVFSVIVVVVAIAAFFGGMYVGRPGAQAPAIQTVTIGSTVTVTRTITQTVMQTPTTPTQTQPSTPPISLPSKIVLGLAIPLSGRQAEEGKKGFWGIMAAVKWVNEVYGGVNLYGKKIPLEVKYYDDESKKENVISYTERLITVDKVHFLLSSYTSALVFAQATVAEKYKMLLVNVGGGSDTINQQGYKYIVSLWTPASRWMWMVYDALKSIDPGAKKISILYADDEGCRILGGGASAKAKELGFNVVYEKVYPAVINDFSPYITDLAKSGADALIVCAHLVNGQLFTKQLADAGVNFKLIAINPAPCIPSYYDALKILAEGIVCPSQWEPGVKYTPDLAKKMGVEWFGPTSDEFLPLLRSVTGDPNFMPSYHTGAGAAGVLLLVRAIELAQSLDPTAVREAFNKLRAMTLFGLFEIDPVTGMQIAHEMVLGQWQNGRFVVVWPPDVAEKKLYYPLPTWDEKKAGKTASY
ncbi:MAG: branched-chain amino acid ABC transporter substrate-binding protein [Desulfurococcaceae archaeon]|nr:MAG: branched-chain amino acid ABC transporter substrate-binding protein [Desulfurococcaceae archaeon]